MKQYLFIGEKRSDLAIMRGYRWEDGRLAGKQLFDALKHCNIDTTLQCTFLNWFEWDDSLKRVKFYAMRDYIIVGMGQKVQKELKKNNIKFIPLVHPAARGKIRAKDVYLQHVKEALT